VAVDARQLNKGPPKGPPAAAQASSAPEGLSAPLFHSLIQRLQSGGRWVVLDLGAAHSATIRALGKYRCRLEIVDLADGLDSLNGEVDPRRIRQRAEALLPQRHGEPTDVVLCWDLINYLNQPALNAVMECIALRCKRGALAHGLVYYSAKAMPERPSTFLPVDDQRIVQHIHPGRERPAPRYTPEDLARCMPRYNVERGRLLRNDMQEFLFRL
jgi:hypothetical protein